MRGVAGFGSGVVATPLLTFVLPLSVTAPLITIIGFFVSVRQAMRDWTLIDWRAVAVFIPGSLVGVALGLYVFKTIDQVLLARWLGAYILLYAFYSLFGDRVFRRTLRRRRSGSSIRSPRSARSWQRSSAASPGRSTSRTSTRCACPRACSASRSRRRCSCSTWCARSATSPPVFSELHDLVLVAAAFVPVAFGTLLGDHLHDRLDPMAFRRAIGVLLVASGAGLLLMR